MLELSPVTAGNVYPTPNIVHGNAANANINVGSAAATSVVSDNSDVPDAERYSKFDHSATKTADSGMTFDDVLDMINPLQHIPVVSSVYRAITGETISPVSRVAGDIMYGGIFGVASAILGGVGGVADSIMEAETGKDFAGTVYATLFGDDADKAGDATPQLADSAAANGATAAPAPSATAVTSDAATANNATSPSPALKNQISPNATPTNKTNPSPTTPDASMTITSVAAAANAASSTTPALVAQQGMPLTSRSYPLTPNKLPYGGALAPVKSMQEQNMAMALASSTGVRIGNTIYTGRLMNGPHPLPIASSASAPVTTTGATAAPFQNTYVMAPPANVAATAAPALTDAQQAVAVTITPNAPLTNYSAGSRATGGFTPLPSGLNDDAMIMKALGLYKNVAGSSGANAGSSLNIVN